LLAVQLNQKRKKEKKEREEEPAGHFLNVDDLCLQCRHGEKEEKVCYENKLQ
jgi:ribosomal protein S27E